MPMTYRALGVQSVSDTTGSDHNKSHIKPCGGISSGRCMSLISEKLDNDGDIPPWVQNILSSTMAAIGRQLKQSTKVRHNLTVYRRLHSSKNPYTRFKDADSNIGWTMEY